MRRMIRAAAVTGAAILVAGLLPAAQATAGPKTEIRFGDSSGFEYVKRCEGSGSGPFICGTFSYTIPFMVQVWNRPRPFQPITATYEIESGTAVAGQDFHDLTGGTVTIPTNAAQAYILVETVVDTELEPTETFTVELTSIDVSGTLVGNNPATGEIRDAGRMPIDCDLDQSDAVTVALTCTDRPAGQTWRHDIHCGSGWTSTFATGNEVTGSGTSTAQCPQFTYNSSGFRIVS